MFPCASSVAPYLDEGVQSLAIHLQELRLNVQHVNLGPSNHYSDEDTICSAQPLTRERDLTLLVFTTYSAMSSVCSSYSITGMKYLPSLICIIALQRMSACSLCISLESKSKWQ